MIFLYLFTILDDFKQYAVKMPEYASLFTTYHQLKAANQSSGILSADIIESTSLSDVDEPISSSDEQLSDKLKSD